LEWADHRLNDEAERQKLKEDYHALYADIIVAGRIALAAGGPNKPANFQLFHGTYIPFFDDEDDVCDEISWYLIGAAYRRLLTRDFRKKLNKLAVDLNKVIREAADEYKKYGVFWVDSYVDKFKEHRFCSPTGFGRDFDLVYHSNKFQDDGDRTWFWSIQSRYRNGDEGPHLDQTDWTGRSTPNVTQAILDHLNIDKAGQDKLAQGAPWDQISPALKDEEAFETAISDLEVKDNDGEVIINLNDGFNRVFHPKGTALDVIANGFFDTIVAQRDWTFDKNDAPTSTTPQPTPSSEPTQPEQPVTAGKTLTVGLEQDKQCWDSEQGAQQCTTPENRWFFFTTNTGEEPGTICGELADGFVLKESWKDADFFNNLSWPGGEFNLKLNGMDYVYKCDGSNPGKLFHGEQAFDCWGDLTQEDPKQQECSQDSAFPEKRRRVVSCDF
jgi:hypothetical protein